MNIPPLPPELKDLPCDWKPKGKIVPRTDIDDFETALGPKTMQQFADTIKTYIDEITEQTKEKEAQLYREIFLQITGKEAKDEDSARFTKVEYGGPKNHFELYFDGTLIGNIESGFENNGTIFNIRFIPNK